MNRVYKEKKKIAAAAAASTTAPDTEQENEKWESFRSCKFGVRVYG